MKLSDPAYAALAREHGTPLLVLDVARLQLQVQRLQAALPGVGLYYAVKACVEMPVLAALQGLDVGFDVASRGELEQLRTCGVAPQRIIHTHPIKTRAEICAALRQGCTTFVVDNVTEIDKFVEFRSRVGLLLRLAVKNPDAVVNLSHKFGCDVADAPGLLMHAQRHGIHIKGLSFHVGSQTRSSQPYVQAIAACQQLIEDSRSQGQPLRMLDIGGGFPIDYQNSGDSETQDMAAFCQPIRAALLSLPESIEVIAEPGRYIVAPAISALSEVVGVSQRGGQPWYYLNDGVYGSFSGQVYDQAQYPIRALGQAGAVTVPSTLAGPTCDSIDVLVEQWPLPELQVGDVLLAEHMGAYTSASASGFNGLEKAKMVVVNEPECPARVVPFRRRA